MGRAPALVFLRIDVPLSLPGGPSRFIELQFAAHPFDQSQLVVAVQDLEILRQPGLLPVGFEQAMGQAVEGAQPHTVSRYVQHLLDAAAHLARGLVGKGDREQRVGGQTLGADQPRHTVHQNAGFAGPGAGQHEHVATICRHGVALGVVQAGKNIADIHGRILTASAPPPLASD